MDVFYFNLLLGIFNLATGLLMQQMPVEHRHLLIWNPKFSFFLAGINFLMCLLLVLCN